MRRGINLGNVLDAGPTRNEPLALDGGHLDAIRDAGFDTVRIPIAWAHHADHRAPYTIAPDFFASAERLTVGAIDRGFDVVIDLHHDDQLCDDPDAHGDRFRAMWRQIGHRFRDLPSNVWFELLNEPTRQLAGSRWNELLAAGLAVVRVENPARVVVVGPAAMNTVAGLDELVLPHDDSIVVTVHIYSPMSFTHQGADWWPGADRWVGTRWGTPADHDALTAELARAADWARRHGHPLMVGEFGAVRTAPPGDRVAWTAHVRRTAEQLGLPWCAWDFATDFGAYDPRRRRWDRDLLGALIPPEPDARVP